MSFTLALAQTKHPSDGDVARMVEQYAARAFAEQADLLVFPEALMTRYDGSIEAFRAAAQPADGPFARMVSGAAAHHGLWIAFTMNERNPQGGLPYNTAILVDDAGKIQAHYRKVHLFDAQGEQESSRMSAGSKLARPAVAPFATVGLAICYDLRFPEVALKAALAGAQIMLYPAAWVDGPGKVRQWETLLAARAIENGMFVAGVGSADAGRIGRSCVFGPDGALVASGPEREDCLVLCDIDLSEIERVRAATPSLEHRRPDCY